MAFLSLVVMLGLLVVIYRTWSRWPLDLVGLFCATFMWFYGLRATVITLGFDDLFPDYLFDQANSPIAQTNLLLALFLLGVIVGLALGSTASVRLGWLIPRVVREPTPRRYQQVATALTALAIVLLAVQVLRYADFGSLLRATKVDKETQGTFLLRIVPAMGAVVSMAWFLSALRARRAGRRAPVATLAVAASLAVINGLCDFAVGSRTLLVLVVFGLLVGGLIFGRAPHTGHRSLAPKVLVAALLILAVVVGLRFTRDTLLSGDINQPIANESVIRQISVAANMAEYDALVLAVRDWPEIFPYRGGEDFIDGLYATVPRAIRPDAPLAPSPGTWFRQVYEPEVANGWPMGPAGEWYLNFGWLGVAIGGLASGLLFGIASNSLRRSHDLPLAWITSLVITMQVAIIGVNVRTPLRWVGWCLPLVALVWMLGAARREPQRADAEAAESAVPDPTGDRPARSPSGP